MSNRLIIASNILEPENWNIIETDNIIESLINNYPNGFPKNARLYHEHVSQATDITPSTEQEVSALLDRTGTFYCMEYPEGTVATVIAVIVAVVAVAATFFIKPSIPSVVSAAAENRNIQSSPNNELSDRQNTARLNKRIPYIVGRVVATPDLITVPYKIFVSNQEVEHCTMCIGEGYYQINSVMDDEIRFDEVAGNAIQIYEPNKQIDYNSPFYTLGQPFSDPLYNVFQSSSVTGQTLAPPGSESITGSSNIVFSYPNAIATTSPQSVVDFTNLFVAGDHVTISNASWSGTNLNGSYTILAVSVNTIWLDNPRAVNAGWDNLAAGSSPYLSPLIVSDYYKVVGPFQLNMENRTHVIANVVAMNGMYKDDGKNQYAHSINYRIGVTQTDEYGNAIGGETEYQVNLMGSSSNRNTVGASLIQQTVFTGPCKVRVWRITVKDEVFSGTIVEEAKLRELYAAERITGTDANFGPHTILRSKTVTSPAALALKDRKIQVDVTRKFPLRNADNTFTAELYPTTSAADILCAVCIEPTIGNRSLSELNISNIYNTHAKVVQYFGTSLCGEFNYTFDDANISFEEYVESIANAIFCKAYRRGNIINLAFENPENNAVLLFNHRNKVPDSETRTITYGVLDNNDGVELNYVSPIDGAILTYHIPEDQSAINPKKLDTIGIRSKTQAYFQSWRAWNKMQYQNVVCEFTATDESSILLITDKILNSDNTRLVGMEGDVQAVDGLYLTLSQPVTEEVPTGHYIWLQLSDGTTQSIRITEFIAPNRILLQEAPRIPLVTDHQAYSKTTYFITNDDINRQTFLVSELSNSDKYTNNVKCVNFDERYYQNDKDFIKGVAPVVASRMALAMPLVSSAFIEDNY